MEQIKTQYYPNDKKFTEISIRFMGNRANPTDLKCYLDLISLNKKLGIKLPDYITENKFLSYGNFFRYGVRTILDEKQKMNNAKTICCQLIKYGIKTNTIPIIEFIMYGEHTTVFTLEDYLQTKGIKLEELHIEELTEKGKSLER